MLLPSQVRVNVALLAEGVDRNYCPPVGGILALLSPSSWRAWIEIPGPVPGFAWIQVALLMEGVDRNYKYLNTGSLKGVALLMEGVDRNPLAPYV